MKIFCKDESCLYNLSLKYIFFLKIYYKEFLVIELKVIELKNSYILIIVYFKNIDCIILSFKFWENVKLYIVKNKSIFLLIL